MIDLMNFLKNAPLQVHIPLCQLVVRYFMQPTFCFQVVFMHSKQDL